MKKRRRRSSSQTPPFFIEISKPIPAQDQCSTRACRPRRTIGAIGTSCASRSTSTKARAAALVGFCTDGSRKAAPTTLGVTSPGCAKTHSKNPRRAIAAASEPVASQRSNPSTIRFTVILDTPPATPRAEIGAENSARSDMSPCLIRPHCPPQFDVFTRLVSGLGGLRMRRLPEVVFPSGLMPHPPSLPLRGQCRICTGFPILHVKRGTLIPLLCRLTFKSTSPETASACDKDDPKKNAGSKKPASVSICCSLAYSAAS